MNTQFIFEQSREAWKDIRSNSTTQWQILALCLAVLGLTANVLVSGEPPVFSTSFGWFLMLFAASFVAICAYVLLWLKISMFRSVLFIMKVETELEKSEKLNITITKSSLSIDSANSERKEGPLISMQSIGVPISVIIWFLFFLEIGISVLWLFQMQSPIINLNNINFNPVLNIVPIAFLIGSYAMIASNYNIMDEYAIDSRSNIRMSIFKRIMAIWAILHPYSFSKFWNRENSK